MFFSNAKIKISVHRMPAKAETQAKTGAQVGSRNTWQDGPDGPNGPNGHAAVAANTTATARMREWLRTTQCLSAKDRA